MAGTNKQAMKTETQWAPRPVGIVDEADAQAFEAANTATMLYVGDSKERAEEILKASGYLTDSGEVAKRYRLTECTD